MQNSIISNEIIYNFQKEEKTNHQKQNWYESTSYLLYIHFEKFDWLKGIWNKWLLLFVTQNYYILFQLCETGSAYLPQHLRSAPVCLVWFVVISLYISMLCFVECCSSFGHVLSYRWQFFTDIWVWMSFYYNPPLFDNIVQKSIKAFISILLSLLTFDI